MLPRPPISFLSGGGECGALAQSTDWSKTALGPPDSWPTSLKTTVGILLHSRHPMFLFWGPEFVQLYNDAYLPSFGVGKHPAAMGQRGADCWPEIWHIIGPQLDDVMHRGVPSWNEDHLVPIFRNGRIEEVYWTYSYSPVFDESGGIGGTLVVCTETTARVVAQRRLAIVRRLAAGLMAMRNAGDVAQEVIAVLAGADYDVPFALFFEEGEPVAVGLDAASTATLRGALEGRLERADVLSPDVPLPGGRWPEPVTRIFVAPVETSSGRALAFGLSSRLPFDGEYRSFLEQVAELAATARARLRIEEERQRLLEQAPVATAILVGPEHLFESANPLYCRMVGRNVVGKTYLEAFPELKDTPLPGILDRVYQQGEPFVTHELVVPLDRSDNGTVEDAFFQFNLEPIRNVDGRVYGMMAVASEVTTQVTARREVERLLARAELGEAQLRELVDNLPELAWHARADGHIDFYNRRWYEYTGTTFAQMEGWGWKALHRPDLLEVVEQRWRSSLATGECFEMEFPLRGADGVYRWFLTRVRPMRDKEGRITRWFGTNTDIDVRARNEEFRELFIAILGHDLRNPLSAIMNGAQLLLLRNATSETTRVAERIRNSGKRMLHMVEQLLDMTRARFGGGIPIARSATPLDLTHLASRIVDEVRSAHPGRTVELLAEGDHLASVDGDRIEQVMSNLLGNALTHGDHARPVRVKLSDTGGISKFSVHNFGPPIAPETMQTLFDPFQRGPAHRGKAEGLGLGLFIVHEIVRSHGGSIHVESTSEGGTRFDVVLPIHTGQ